MRKIVIALAMLACIAAFASAAYPAEITLAWDASLSEDVVGYELCKAPSAGMDGATCNAVTKELTGKMTVGAGVTFFACKAVASDGQRSAWSNVVSTSINAQPPSPPRNLTKTGVVFAGLGMLTMVAFLMLGKKKGGF